MKWVVRTPSGERELDVERRHDGLFRVVESGGERIVDLARLNGSLASLRCTDDNSSWRVVARKCDRHKWRIGLWKGDLELDVLTPAEAAEGAAGGAASGSATLTAPIPGKVVAVRVAVGEQVTAGQPLVVLEAMKMENELAAEREGEVRAVLVQPGQTVEAGAPLVELVQ